MSKRFTEVMEYQIFDKDQNLIKDYKAVVDVKDPTRVLSIVGKDYKIAQHDEVFDLVEKSCSDLSLVNKMNGIELRDGRRLRVDVTFPEVTQSIAGESIQMWAALDNSHDGSTGLRLEVNAYIPQTDCTVYCTKSEIISDKMSKFYHRHTKGLEVEVLDRTISKGIEVFQNEMAKEFNQLAATPLTSMSAKAFIQELIDTKSCKIARKYLDMISEAIEVAGSRLTNAWAFYSMISSILTKEVASIDNRRNNARELLSKIKRHSF